MPNEAPATQFLPVTEEKETASAAKYVFEAGRLGHGRPAGYMQVAQRDLVVGTHTISRTTGSPPAVTW